jgi:RNA polymerase sigma-70 factor (ECF subfamily)
MVQTEPSDAELLDLIAERGEEARRAEQLLCARFGPRVRLYGLKHLRDHARAEDLMQHVLLLLLEAARKGSIRERAHVDRFVLGTCRLSAQRMRSHQQREQTKLDERPETPVEPFEQLDTSALVQCVQALEQRARQVIILSFQEERSADEIAAALAMTAGNVRVVRHRALLALRQCMDRKGRGDSTDQARESKP